MDQISEQLTQGFRAQAVNVGANKEEIGIAILGLFRWWRLKK